MLIGIPTLATVSVGGTYLGTGETWESSILKRGRKVKYEDGEEWTFNAQEVKEDWKEFFECCCKTDTSGCSSSGVDSSGECKPSDSKIWKVKTDKKDAIKQKCSKLGSRVDWAWNRNIGNTEYTNYMQFCFKDKPSGGTSN